MQQNLAYLFTNTKLTKNAMMLLALLFFLSTAGFAQKPTVSLSPEYKLPKNKVLNRHLHSDNSGHYMYFSKYKKSLISIAGKSSEKVILEKYDNEFKQVFSKEFVSSKKNIHSLGLKYFKDKFAWMLYEKNKKDDYLEFFLTPIDMKGNSGNPSSIAKFTYKKRKDFPGIAWQVSNDTTKILFIAESDRNDKTDKIETYISVLDNDFNKLWDKKVKLPYTQRKAHTYSWVIDNNGNVFFLCKIYDDNKRKESKGKGRKKKPAYKIKLFKVAPDGTPEEYKLDLKNVFARGMGLKFDEDNNLACVGFYSDNKSAPLQGVFYSKIDGTSGELLFADKRRFTTKEIKSFGTKNTSKDKKSKDEGLDDEFRFQRIIFKKNGEILATAEENYSYTITSTNYQGQMTSTTYYVSNSIVTIEIANNGKVKQVSIIPKKQNFTTPIYGYHSNIITEDQVYFVYNDDKDNLKKNITDPNKIKRISSTKHCIAVLTVLDEKGKMNRKQLFTKKEAKSLLMPNKSSQISGERLFFFTVKPKVFKNTLRFGTISLK